MTVEENGEPQIGHGDVKQFTIKLTPEAKMHTVNLQTGEVYSYDPSSIEEVIAAYEWQGAQLDDPPSARNRSKGPLGLDPWVVSTIKRECIREFLETAALSDELRQSRQRLRERPGSRQNPEWAGVAFARACQRSLTQLSANYADALTQALLTKRGGRVPSHRTIRDLWKECLQFTKALIEGDLVLSWIDRAWGT